MLALEGTLLAMSNVYLGNNQYDEITVKGSMQVLDQEDGVVFRVDPLTGDTTIRGDLVLGGKMVTGSEFGTDDFNVTSINEYVPGLGVTVEGVLMYNNAIPEFQAESIRELDGLGRGIDVDGVLVKDGRLYVNSLCLYGSKQEDPCAQLGAMMLCRSVDRSTAHCVPRTLCTTFYDVGGGIDSDDGCYEFDAGRDSVSVSANTITSDKIMDLSILNQDLADGSVTSRNTDFTTLSLEDFGPVGRLTPNDWVFEDKCLDPNQYVLITLTTEPLCTETTEPTNNVWMAAGACKSVGWHGSEIVLLTYTYQTGCEWLTVSTGRVWDVEVCVDSANLAVASFVTIAPGATCETTVIGPGVTATLITSGVCTNAAGTGILDQYGNENSCISLTTSTGYTWEAAGVCASSSEMVVETVSQPLNGAVVAVIDQPSCEIQAVATPNTWHTGWVCMAPNDLALLDVTWLGGCEGTQTLQSLTLSNTGRSPDGVAESTGNTESVIKFQHQYQGVTTTTDSGILAVGTEGHTPSLGTYFQLSTAGGLNAGAGEMQKRLRISSHGDMTVYGGVMRVEGDTLTGVETQNALISLGDDSSDRLTVGAYLAQSSLQVDADGDGSNRLTLTFPQLSQAEGIEFPAETGTVLTSSSDFSALKAVAEVSSGSLAAGFGRAEVASLASTADSSLLGDTSIGNDNSDSLAFAGFITTPTFTFDTDWDNQCLVLEFPDPTSLKDYVPGDWTFAMDTDASSATLGSFLPGVDSGYLPPATVVDGGALVYVNDSVAFEWPIYDSLHLVSYSENPAANCGIDASAACIDGAPECAKAWFDTSYRAATCVGADDGAGAACALNAGATACVVQGGDCVNAYTAARNVLSMGGTQSMSFLAESDLGTYCVGGRNYADTKMTLRVRLNPSFGYSTIDILVTDSTAIGQLSWTLQEAAMCVGADDLDGGGGAACVLDAGRGACAVQGGDCVYTAAGDVVQSAAGESTHSVVNGHVSVNPDGQSYTFTITDRGDDGIRGDGGYEIKVDDVTVASGSSTFSGVTQNIWAGGFKGSATHTFPVTLGTLKHSVYRDEKGSPGYPTGEYSASHCTGNQTNVVTFPSEDGTLLVKHQGKTHLDGNVYLGGKTEDSVMVPGRFSGVISFNMDLEDDCCKDTTTAVITGTQALRFGGENYGTLDDTIGEKCEDDDAWAQMSSAGAFVSTCSTTVIAACSAATADVGTCNAAGACTFIAATVDTCYTTEVTACAAANGDDSTCQAAGACTFADRIEATCLTTVVPECSAANSDSATCLAAGACTFDPQTSSCTTSIATACASANADASTCSAAGTCSFTDAIEATCTTTVVPGCAGANSDATACGNAASGMCSFVAAEVATCETTEVSPCVAATADAATCAAAGACTFVGACSALVADLYSNSVDCYVVNPTWNGLAVDNCEVACGICYQDAKCEGANDGTSTACALNTESTACNVQAGDCVFTPVYVAREPYQRHGYHITLGVEEPTKDVTILLPLEEGTLLTTVSELSGLKEVGNLTKLEVEGETTLYGDAVIGATVAGSSSIVTIESTVHGEKAMRFDAGVEASSGAHVNICDPSENGGTTICAGLGESGSAMFPESLALDGVNGGAAPNRWVSADTTPYHWFVVHLAKPHFISRVRAWASRSDTALGDMCRSSVQYLPYESGQYRTMAEATSTMETVISGPVAWEAYQAEGDWETVFVTEAEIQGEMDVSFDQVTTEVIRINIDMSWGCEAYDSTGLFEVQVYGLPERSYTSLAVAAPSFDRTLTLPDESGTLLTDASTIPGTFTSGVVLAGLNVPLPNGATVVRIERSTGGTDGLFTWPTEATEGQMLVVLNEDDNTMTEGGVSYLTAKSLAAGSKSLFFYAAGEWITMI